MSDVCSSILTCANAFQTAFSGILAVGAAVIGGAYVLRSSRLPVEAQRAQVIANERRKAIYVSRVLAAEFRRVEDLARQASGTIQNIIASQAQISEATRSKTIIDIHPILDDIDSMSLLPEHLAREALDIRHALHRHNFDMQRAGGSYGDTNFQRQVRVQADGLFERSRSAASSFHQYAEKIAGEAPLN